MVDIDLTNASILRKVRKLDKNQAIYIIEQAVKKPDLEGSKALLNYYKLFIKPINWPANGIEQYKKQVIPEKKKRGRVVIFTKQPKPFEGLLPEESIVKNVWVHRLHDLQFGVKTGEYNITSLLTKAIDRFRVFENGEWRDINLELNKEKNYFEIATLNAVFHQYYGEILLPFESMEIYGLMTDGTLRIIDQEKYKRGRVINRPDEIRYYLEKLKVSSEKSWDDLVKKDVEKAKVSLIDFLKQNNMLLVVNI